MTTNEDHQANTSQPRKRFSEFEGTGDWVERKIGDFLTESREKGSKGDVARKLTVKLWGKGVFEKEEALSGSVNTQYYRRSAGQFIYSKLDFLNQAFGIIPDALDGYETTIDLPCFDIKPGLNPKFLLEYVQRESFYKKNGEIADGGRKAKRIQPEVFFDMLIILPRKVEEQEAIAEAILALDVLIEAETEKLDALQNQNKGLMQQLIPVVGETMPDRRLYGQQPGLEWKLWPLGELVDNLSNRRVPVSKSDRKPGSIPYYGASGIVDYVDDYLFDEDLLCVSEDGANLVARSTPIAFSISGKTWVNNHAHVLRPKSKTIQKIIETYLNFISLQDFLTGMAQPKLNKAKLESIPIPLPRDEEEQSKLTGLFNSIDETISAQTEKLDALRLHKQGLLQQLFPILYEEQG